MTLQQKAKWLTDFWAQIAAGKTAQEFYKNQWQDVSQGELAGPDAGSDLTEWRIKPEPRRMWRDERGAVTTDKEDAAAWKRQGHTVTEWMEVV